MSIFNHLALENEDVAAQPDITETQTELETSVDEQTMVQTDVEEMTAAIESAIDEASDLEEIGETLEESVEEGEGVSEDAARVVDIAVESIRARLGMPASVRSTRVVPALESFGSSASRLTATQIALEGIGDQVKKVWETIKRVAAQVWEKIKSFFVGLLRNASLLKKHLEALKARAKAVPAGAKPAKEVLDSKSLAVALGNGAKADASTVKELNENAIKLVMAGANFNEGIHKAAAEMTKALTGDIGNIEFLKPAEAALSVLPVVKEEGNKTVYGPFGGGKVITVTKKEEGEDVTFDLTIGKAEAKASAITALTQAQLVGVIDEALQIVTTLQDTRKTSAAYEKAEKVLRTTIEKGINAITAVEKATASDDEAGKEAVKQATANQKKVQRSLRTYIGMASRVNSSFPGIAFTTAKAMADYVSLSINNLKTEEAA